MIINEYTEASRVYNRLVKDKGGIKGQECILITTKEGQVILTPDEVAQIYLAFVVMKEKDGVPNQERTTETI